MPFATTSRVQDVRGRAAHQTPHQQEELVSYETLLALGCPYVARLCERLRLPPLTAGGQRLCGALLGGAEGDEAEALTPPRGNERYLLPLAPMLAESDERERAVEEARRLALDRDEGDS